MAAIAARAHLLQLRLSADELAQMRARAGEEPLSTWLRRIALDQPAPAPRRRPARERPPHPQSAELTRAALMAGNRLHAIVDLLGQRTDGRRLLDALAPIRAELRHYLEIAKCLNSVFSRGSEAAAGIDYGLSKHDHTGTERSVAPRVLYGDPESVKAAVNTLNCRQRYTAGVLSFAEADLPMQLKKTVIREHLSITFPGLDPARIAATDIQHQDKGFLELHYWICNLDLKTGKRLNAYYDRENRGRTKIGVELEIILEHSERKHRRSDQGNMFKIEAELSSSPPTTATGSGSGPSATAPRNMRCTLRRVHWPTPTAAPPGGEGKYNGSGGARETHIPGGLPAGSAGRWISLSKSGQPTRIKEPE